MGSSSLLLPLLLVFCCMATTTSNLNLATEHGQPASMTKIIHSWEQETSLTLLYELPRTQSSSSYSAMTKFLRIPYCPPPPPTKTFWSLPACMTWSTLSYHSCIPCSPSPQSVWVAFRCIKIPHPNSFCWYCLQRGQDWPRLERSVADHHQRTNQGIDLR